MTHTRIKIIGLAGESGTGKSTIARFIVETYDAAHIDGDRVGHELLVNDAATIADVIKLVGDGVVGDDGHIDRNGWVRSFSATRR